MGLNKRPRRGGHHSHGLTHQGVWHIHHLDEVKEQRSKKERAKELAEQEHEAALQGFVTISNINQMVEAKLAYDILDLRLREEGGQVIKVEIHGNKHNRYQPDVSVKATVQLRPERLVQRLLEQGRFQAPGLAHKGENIWFNPYRSDLSKPYKKHGADRTVQAASVHIGSLCTSSTFISEWHSYSTKLQVSMNLLRRHMVIHLSDHSRMVLRFKHIEGQFQLATSTHSGKPCLLIKAAIPPRIWKREGEHNPQNSATWVDLSKYVHPYAPEDYIPADADADSWARAMDFTPGKALQRNQTIVIELVPEDGFNTFNSSLLSKLYHFKLLNKDPGDHAPVRELFKGEHVAIQERLPQEVEEVEAALQLKLREELHCDVAYLVLCLLTDGVLNYWSLVESGYKFLEALKGWAVGPCREALLLMLGRRRRHLMADESVEMLRAAMDEVGAAAGGAGEDELVSAHCVQVRRLMVTPARVKVVPEEVEMSNRVVREWAGDGGVLQGRDFLRVTFGDEHGDHLFDGRSSSDADWWKLMRSVMLEGIKLLGKHYEFLAYSSSQLKEQSLWMVATAGSSTTPDGIRRWMGDFFETIKVPGKCVARMGQCFSSTVRTSTLDNHQYREIPDVERNGYVFSDGVGQISPELLTEVLQNVPFAQGPHGGDISAIQVRFGGCKGVLTLHPPLKGKTLRYRPSMHKFGTTHSTVEVCAVALPIPSYLNRAFILLLQHNGVRPAVFTELQLHMLQQLDKMTQERLVALQLLPTMGGVSGNIVSVLLDMLGAGRSPASEPFLNSCLRAIRAHHLMELKRRTRILMPDSSQLIGVMDEYGLLKPGEVFVQIRSRADKPLRVLQGQVVVAKHPVMHPGDVRIFQAVYVRKLMHLKNVLVLPQTGDRPHANEMSGSDLDGDQYVVIWDRRLMFKNNPAPMDYSPPPLQEVKQVTIEHVVDHFVGHAQNNNLGRIANTWLVHADKNSAGCDECLELAALHSRAVDFPKTGVPAVMRRELIPREYPHWMEKKGPMKYTSTSIIAKLYNGIIEHCPALQKKNSLPDDEVEVEWRYDLKLEYPGFEEHLEEAYEARHWYECQVHKLRNRYSVWDEGQLLSGCIQKFHKLHKRKQADVKEQLGREVAQLWAECRRWFFRSLLPDSLLEEADRAVEEQGSSALKALVQRVNHQGMLAAASAWYAAVYHPAHRRTAGNGARQLLHSFPWVVADVLREVAEHSGPSSSNAGGARAGLKRGREGE